MNMISCGLSNVFNFYMAHYHFFFFRTWFGSSFFSALHMLWWWHVAKSRHMWLSQWIYCTGALYPIFAYLLRIIIICYFKSYERNYKKFCTSTLICLKKFIKKFVPPPLSNTIYKSKNIFLQLRRYCHIGKKYPSNFQPRSQLKSDKLYCFTILTLFV